jgi:flagellar basal body-associated protein FliL
MTNERRSSILALILIVACVASVIGLCILSGRFFVSQYEADNLIEGMNKAEVYQRIGTPHEIYSDKEGNEAELYRVWGYSDMMWVWYSDEEIVEEINF